MKERIIKNWKSSLIGGLLLIIGIIALLCGKMSDTVFITLLVPLVLILLGIKDTGLLKLLIIAPILIIISCSPQKKLNRFLKKHPELIKIDTLIINDTIYSRYIEKDTIVALDTLIKSDTIIINQDKLQIKIKYFRDSIYIKGECLSDTVFITKKVPIERIQYVSNIGYKKGFEYLIILIISIIIIVWVIKYFERKV